MVADMPATMMLRSTGRPAWSAANTPMARLSGTTSRNATAASFAELARALAMNGATGAR
jgi:hypothetical protein